ncbi:MAG: family 16 glycosylhydrolase [Granulosicoccus sp.]
MTSKILQWCALPGLFFFSLGAFANPPVKVLPNNQWVMLSPPVDPDTSGTLRQLFGDDLNVNRYEEAWVVYGWDPLVGARGRYFIPTLDQRLEEGQGYWVIQNTGTDVTIDVPANSRAVAAEEIPGCIDIRGCIESELAVRNGQQTWTMAGFNHDAPLSMRRVSIVTGAASCYFGCTLNEAFSAPASLGSGIYRYVNPSVGYERLTESSVLQPWDAYWIATTANALGARDDDGNFNGARMLFPTVPATTAMPRMADYELVFRDEFNSGGQLDRTKWNTGLLWGPYQTINNEEQLYVDTLGMHEGFEYDPFTLTGDGTLKITASKVTPSLQPPVKPADNDPVWGQYLEYRSNPEYNPADTNYLSGIITTYDTFKLSHGYVEARAKLPGGQGLWPAVWMLTTHYVNRVPEIDIMEFLGDKRNRVYHTYHYFKPENDWELVSTPSNRTIGPDFTDDFHVFGAAWEPGQIIFYVDGVEVHRVSDEDYEIAGQGMYLILNLAVGGDWPKAPDASTEFPAVFEIDYIRAYKKKLSVPVNLNEYQLVFNDEFTGSRLNPNKWSTSFVWGPFLPINDELQYYVDTLGADRGANYSPFTLSGGTTPQTGFLTITARTAADSGNMPRVLPGFNSNYWNSNPISWRQADYTPPDYTSGIITSREAFRFSKGYAEIRAKVPDGDGLWPAFWLLNAYYVGPTPEIDIMEILGEDTRTNHHSFHYQNEVGELVSTSKQTRLRSGVPSFSEDFHTFGVQWLHDEIHWYIDGVNVHSVYDTEVAYQIMYVLANLAVGGTFNSVPLDPTAIPAELVIDYIRVYQERDTN